MANRPPRLQQKIESFQASCREAGLKLTHQRLGIFHELAAAVDHPTAETLYKRLKKSMPTLSLDTVYRTLATFEEHDLISRVHTVESHARFEADLDKHHHAICTRCQRITDFYWDVCDSTELPAQISNWGMIKDRQITIRGICSDCIKGGVPEE